MSGYIHLDVEEVVTETATHFLFRFHDGESEWIMKEEIANCTSYNVGDKEVTVHLVQ